MNPEEAAQLDHELADIIASSESSFIRIGRIMDRICEFDSWRLLDNPHTRQPFLSLEDWVTFRFRGQRATAFAARRIYRTLKPNVPDEVLDKAEPGSLKILAMLPESAQKNRRVQRDLMSKTVAEFTTLAIEAFPDQLIEKRISWSLKPTLSQAALYDRILTKVQDWYAKQGEPVSKEDALEYILQEAEERL